MDKTDLAIIEKLAEDARTSFRKIARDLGISTETVINRYKKLQAKKVIRGSTVVIDPKQIGYEAIVAFLIDVYHANIAVAELGSDTSVVLDKLVQMPNIIVATKTVGDHDLLAIGVTQGIRHLIRLGNEIAEIQGIKNIEISFWHQMRELSPKYFAI